MASIRNSISLQDRMSPVFRSIIRSMDSTLRVMRVLDKQANNGAQSKAYRRAERDLKRANNELIKMQNHLNRADGAAGKLANSTNRISSNMMKMSQGGFNLTNLASGLYLLKNIANTVSSIMDTPDTLGAIQYRLDTYDTTSATGQELFDAAYMEALNSRSDVDSTANLASRILVSGATDGNGAQAIDLAGLLNKASFLGGSSSQESERALLQLSQALASGVLQGDELRAIREQAPGLTDTLARGLSSLGEKGILPESFIGTTSGDLKQLGADGELTADRIIAAFREMSDYIDTAFEDSPKQFGQAMTGIGNVWKRWLKMMGEGDNALAKINDRAWELLEYFMSADGTQFFESLSRVINTTVDVIFTLIDGIGQLINWFGGLENSTEIMQSAFITLAVVAAGAALVMAISWAVANWQILLTISIIGILIYAFLATGYTANEVVGGIIGAILFLAYTIYDMIVWLITIVYWAISLVWDALVALSVTIINLIIAAVTIIILAIQIAVQLFLWAALAIASAFVTVYNILYTLVKGAWGVIKGAIVAIYGMFVSLGEGVLGVLYMIASAIDWVFGSNLADTVGGWMDGLAQSVEDLNTALDPLGEFEDIGTQWTLSYQELGDMWAGKGEYDGLFLGDAMEDLALGSADLMGEFGQTGVDMMLDPTALDQWAIDATVNPMDGWNTGYDFGYNLVDEFSGMDVNMSMSDLSGIEGLLNDFSTDGLGVDGGDIDSVGKIKSDVDISDEDIKLLRDIAARDFLLNLQTITPVANIKFGDVRETADIDKIMEVIQDMVDEELATSLVVN